MEIAFHNFGLWLRLGQPFPGKIPLGMEIMGLLIGICWCVSIDPIAICLRILSSIIISCSLHDLNDNQLKFCLKMQPFNLLVAGFRAKSWHPCITCGPQHGLHITSSGE